MTNIEKDSAQPQYWVVGAMLGPFTSPPIGQTFSDNALYGFSHTLCIPTNYPRDEFAKHGIGVGVGAAGDGDHPGKLGVAKRGGGEIGRAHV